MNYSKVLLKPLITEKATLAKDEANQVVFEVHQDANKIEVRRAVEEAFKVKVEKVNIVRKASRARRRWGKVTGRISGQKKAYVTLVEGEKIDLFEGV
mgnify:CR=1 FL=1